jgi:hypothetical protein
MLAASSSGAVTEAAPEAGSNPFWSSSNWYCEKMPDIITQTLGSSQIPVSNKAVNPGQFLRGPRLQVRSTGGAGGAVTPDNPFNVLASAELDNVDGANIQYPMPMWSHMLRNLYGRPWLGDPRQRYDYAESVNPSFTAFLQPEIRHTAGVLSNTDSRSQYKYSYTFETAAGIGATGTAPTVTVTPFMDAWAQPDAKDLQDRTNQPLPPGLNVQTVSRHETQTLNNAGANNVLLSHLTGNEVRLFIMQLRDSNNARQDYVGDPLRWTLDSRNMGVFNPDELFQWMSDFYSSWGGAAPQRPTGVYVFPRYYDVGGMLGQGWLGTTNATKWQFEFTTAAGATNLPGTVEFITEEVIPVGPIPPELDHI